MIGKILNGVLQFVINTVTLLLTPIDNLITTNFPSLDNALSSINSFINYIISVIGYAIDASCLTDVVLLLVVGYYSFTIVLSVSTYVIKLILKWYKALVP